MDLLEIGKLLKEERLRQGVELPAVAKMTRISTSALAAIEEGNESALPTPVYIKGFVKNYAYFLKLDPEVVAHALEDVRFASGNAMWSPSQSLPVPRRPFPVWRVGVAALVIIVLTGGGATLYHLRSGERLVVDPPPTALETPPPPPLSPTDDVALPAWQPVPPQPLQDQPLVTPPPSETAPLAASTPHPTTLEQTAEREADAPQTQGQPATPSVRQDMSHQMADLDNMRLTLRPGNLRADFEIRNLSNDLISGSIAISFISSDDRTVPALGNEEIPRFNIRNYRPVSTRLHLPPELNLDDVTRVQFVVTDSDGTDVLVKTYPVNQG